jgi:hypothetical protein
MDVIILASNKVSTSISRSLINYSCVFLRGEHNRISRYSDDSHHNRHINNNNNSTNRDWIKRSAMARQLYVEQFCCLATTPCKLSIHLSCRRLLLSSLILVCQPMIKAWPLLLAWRYYMKQKQVALDVSRNTLSLTDLLKIPLCLARFSEFLSKEFCVGTASLFSLG